MSQDDLQIRLDIFEGPLDLLLHLVRVNEYDIFDIPVADITHQFNEYLDLMQELNLNVAAEYLVMSATLMRVKSRLLLPPTEDEDGEEEDPRAELIQQLLEYQRFKEAAMEISERPMLGRDVFARKFPATDLSEAHGENAYLEVDIYQLLQAMRQVIKNLPSDQVHQIQMSGMSVREKMAELVDLFGKRSTVVFQELFRGAKTRGEVIVTFLALLELVRQSMLKVTQIDPTGPIRIQSLISDGREDDDGH
ncbi:MAG: segregation/condensation protein A [Candidatus Lernaella stagnicola]|nr:segregation/condensation protein A [Candidatus Lernaella stagnicola]